MHGSSNLSKERIGTWKHVKFDMRSFSFLHLLFFPFHYFSHTQFYHSAKINYSCRGDLLLLFMSRLGSWKGCHHMPSIASWFSRNSLFRGVLRRKCGICRVRRIKNGQAQWSNGFLTSNFRSKQWVYDVRFLLQSNGLLMSNFCKRFITELHS